MPYISRRTLIASSLAASVSSLMPHLSEAQSSASPSSSASGNAAIPSSAVGPREQLLFDSGWKFAFGNSSDPVKDHGFGLGQSDFSKTGEFRVAKAAFNDSSWSSLNLPHDWAVELPFEHDDLGDGDSQLRSHGYKPLGRRYPETSVGWYRKVFEIPASDAGRRIWIEFDGAMRDSLIWVNGCFIGRNDHGYTPFRFDLTDFLVYGGKNYIAVRVDASFGDGWFYEGAGIYRHVWLNKMDPVHLGRWETVVRSSLSGAAAALTLSTVVQNESAQAVSGRVQWKILDATGATVATAESPAQSIGADGAATFTTAARLPNPSLWSVERPDLYAAVVSVESGGVIRDAERVTFGVRTATFDPDKGFFLNGKSLKIQGTCNHHDHAGVGAALPDRLQAFRLSVLQEMGCNAVRTSHNMPTPEWVEACDRMGVMMMCENRQMSSSAEGLAQLELMIKRYRNSPSIIIWSIGNEEWQLQGGMAEQGQRIAATMVKRCHELDPTRVVSAAVNGDNEKGVSIPLDIIGFNYNTRKLPAAFHKKYPRRPVFGSETSSALSTRGVYSTDPLRNTMNSYDGAAAWGDTPEQWWNLYGAEEWATGGFAWTGFDYRGEPTPYGWPSISSQFGIVDMCGFPKDYFYYYKAWWRKEPSLHLFPHWTWNGREGDEIPVWVYSNVDEVELFLNGKSLGGQKVPRLGHVEWKVRYEPGILEARGARNGAVVLTERRETTGEPAELRITSDRAQMDADGQDIAMLRVEAFDASGRAVPIADNLVNFKISGEGTLIGVGNGDPNCLESDKAPKRSLFNGLAQGIVQSTRSAGTIVVEVLTGGSGSKVKSGQVEIRTRPITMRPML
jgi:beta-galactosidase